LFGARAIVSPLARTLPGTTRQRAVGFAVAALLAGGLHAALTIGELRVRRDAAYAKIMESERDRRIAFELARWQQTRAEAGAVASSEEARVERDRLERADRPFPFALVLAIATVLALIAGIAMTRGGRDEPIGSRLLARAGMLAVASIAAVIALDLLLAR
jgi:hypothetical protein